MASRYEVEVTISSAKDLKNVNWRYGPNKPYAVVWVDPANKCSTRVDEEGDTCPVWDATLVISIPPGTPPEDATLCIDVVHAGSEEETKPFIGSARLKLRDVIDDVGFGEAFRKSLQLKRSSGRPQGKVDVKVCVRDTRYKAREAYPPPYGVGSGSYGSREYAPPPPAYGQPYGAPPQEAYSGGGGYGYNAPPPHSGYPYNAPPQPAYAQGGYGEYGYAQPPKEEKKSKFGGMGTGLAIGAVAGAVGGIALVEGADYLEDKIAEDAAEKVEDDLGFDGDGDDGGFDL